MSSNSSHILMQVAVALGLVAMAWASVLAGVERRKLAKISPQPSGWALSFAQFTARYLTATQRTIFFASMLCAICLAVVAAISAR